MAGALTTKVGAAIGAAVVLLVLLVGWFALVSPQRSKASDLGSKISDAQTRLELALAQERTLRRDARARASELAALQRALPPDVHMSDILRELSFAGALTGVRVNGITPSGVVPGVGYSTVPLSVDVDGTYFGLVNFLHTLHVLAHVSGSQLHASGRLFRVDQIQFNGGATDEGKPSSNGALSATMTIDAFTSAGSAVPTPTPSTSTSSSDASSAPSSTSTSAAGAP